jgi:uncharacterized protein YdaU (DUF1376 family)
MGLAKPEWFKLDAAKFLCDTLVDAMSTVEVGACIRLLCRQWIDGYIPDDVSMLARLCRRDEAAMIAAWVILAQFFPVIEPGKRANRYMWVEREKVVADLERKSDEGTRAARKRWGEANKKRTRRPNAYANGSPMPDPIAEPMQDQSRPEQSREGAIAPPPPAAARRAHQMPKEFRPNDGHRTFANELAVDLNVAFAAFCDYHGSKGSTFKDWDKALNNWLRKEPKFGQVRTNGTPNRTIMTGSAVENTLALLKGGR